MPASFASVAAEPMSWRSREAEPLAALALAEPVGNGPWTPATPDVPRA